MPKRRRCQRLTPDLRKAVHAEPESNAGAGWWPKGHGHLKSIAESEPEPETDLYDFFQRQNERNAR